MKNILSFDDFVLEESVQLNEGLLQNLFGALLGRDMWSAVQGENLIKDEFKKIDDKLNGFYLTKIKNPNASQDVRQTLVDWADDIYKAKKKLKEETDKNSGDKKEDDKKEGGLDVSVLLGKFKFKGETEDEVKKEIENNEKFKELSDEIKQRVIDSWKKTQEDKELSKKLEGLKSEIEKIDKKYQKTLDDVTAGSADLKRWANILKDKMDDILDKILCGKYDEGSELAKDLEKIQNKEDEELKKKNNEEMKKEQEQLKKLNDERNSVLKKCGAEVTSEKKADGFVKKVAQALKTKSLFEEVSVFDDKKSKTNLEVFNNAGLQKLLGINVKKVGNNKVSKSLFTTLSTLNKIVLTNIVKDFKKTIDNVSGVSMQGFLVSYCNLILSCFDKNTKLQDDLKLCMARCAVYNNTMVGFGLPCPDSLENAKDDDKKSMFAFYVNQTLEEWKKDTKMKEKYEKLGELCKEILKKAEELVEEYKKEQEKELKKEEQQEEQKNNK